MIFKWFNTEFNAVIKKYHHDTVKDCSAFLKQKKIFNELNERHDEILKLSKKANYDDLTFHYKNKNM